MTATQQQRAASAGGREALHCWHGSTSRVCCHCGLSKDGACLRPDHGPYVPKVWTR